VATDQILLQGQAMAAVVVVVLAADQLRVMVAAVDQIMLRFQIRVQR